jgi:hypothetical protein
VVNKLWNGQQALEAVDSSGGGRRLWRRSKALEEVEGSGGGRRLRRQQARSSGGGRKLWRRSKALKGGSKVFWRSKAPEKRFRRLWMGWRRSRAPKAGARFRRREHARKEGGFWSVDLRLWRRQQAPERFALRKTRWGRNRTAGGGDRCVRARTHVRFT